MYALIWAAAVRRGRRDDVALLVLLGLLALLAGPLASAATPAGPLPLDELLQAPFRWGPGVSTGHA